MHSIKFLSYFVWYKCRSPGKLISPSGLCALSKMNIFYFTSEGGYLRVPTRNKVFATPLPPKTKFGGRLIENHGGGFIFSREKYCKIAPSCDIY